MHPTVPPNSPDSQPVNLMEQLPGEVVQRSNGSPPEHDLWPLLLLTGSQFLYLTCHKRTHSITTVHTPFETWIIENHNPLGYEQPSGLDVLNSHPMCRMHFCQYQASSGALGWPSVGITYPYSRSVHVCIETYTYSTCTCTCTCTWSKFSWGVHVQVLCMWLHTNHCRSCIHFPLHYIMLC